MLNNAAAVVRDSHLIVGLDDHTVARGRARREIAAIKKMHRGAPYAFEMRNGVIRGTLVTATTGDDPGTYRLLLRLASAIDANSYCFLTDSKGRRVTGFVTTGPDGLVSIQTKVSALDA